MVFTRITVDPHQMDGVPCIRGLRIPAATVVGMVAEGMTKVDNALSPALFDDEGCYVRALYHWSLQGPASDVTHGGLSLMECLVPMMRIRRER